MGRTHEALLRAGKKFEKLLKKNKTSENVEPQLIDLGLGEIQILEQSTDQLKQSLAKINALIQKQQSKQESRTGFDIESKRTILQDLIKRKELVLGCLDILLTNNKNDEIKNLVNDISDERIKSTLMAKLDELEKLNHFFSQEYLRILQSKKRIITQGK